MKQFAFVMLAVTLVTGVPAAQDLERLFKAAVNTETVDRDCRGAIEQYRKVAAGNNRALAAQALLRMADCYRVMGDVEAQRIYERIVNDYRDQPETSAIARTRLTARATQPAGDRMVKSGPLVTWGDGRVSPDGRLISYVSYDGPEGLNLMLHDLVSGKDRPLTTVDWNGGAAYSSTFSRDGRELAYGWRSYGPGGPINEIRVVRVDNTGNVKPRTIYTNDDVELFHPTDWSPDGRTLAVSVRRKDRTQHIALVGVSDGSYRALRTTEGWRSSNKIFFSPDGAYLAYDLPTSDTDQTRDIFILATDASSLTAVPDPADDVVMGWSPDGRHVLFASDRNGKTGLWAMPVTKGKPLGGPPTLVKPDIGSTESQGLTASGTLHVVKDASTVSFQVAPIDLERGRLSGAAVLQVFRSEPPAWSADGTRLAYMARSANGLPFLGIHSIEPNQVRQLQPRLSYFPHPRWMPDGRSVVVWGRDIKGEGVIERIDVETGRETFIARARDIQQVQVASDGRTIYYQDDFYSGGARPGRVIEHDLVTGAEKEVQGRQPGGATPDARTTVQVRADRNSKTSTVTFQSVGGGEPRTVTVAAVLDGGRGVFATPDGQAVLAASSDERSRMLWLIPASGTPRKLDIDTSSWRGPDFRLSPNGRHIAFFTGQDAREVWAFENVVPASGKR